MAAIQQAPVLSMPGYKSPSDNNTSINHMTHLSGMALAEFVTEPKIHLVEASPSSSKQPMQSPSMDLSSKRSSRASASTTKSQLRQTNCILVDMLQNIQNELAAHRTILLNIQNRVSTLEGESNTSANNDAPQATLRTLEVQDAPPKRNSRLLAPELSSWWQACQTFASNAEPPMSAGEFLKTPHRFSGFDLKWEVPSTPLVTPPDVDDIPSLTPTSEEGDHSELGSPLGQNVFLGEEISAFTPQIAGPGDEAGVDITGRTVEFDVKRLPAPPALQPAPCAKPSVMGNEDVVTAIEPELVGNRQRYFKGVRSLATYKALLKHKPSENEHHVLIHFHRRKDVEHLRAA
ncbi:hypothetical protein P171DRAFT_525102 [Karstenula rhodostoma CBS 690.94]|uniref:Uncharacterized protein n=1 Tax=Karstenula rhodostoma CBS 690.94 TaxID=1392251 RepID=A0A9P4U6F6_9PLEO|nr:hypothetical protein P171DRAFT_525102 [Karstenula rhodostoma CBS 690.94]